VFALTGWRLSHTVWPSPYKKRNSNSNARLELILTAILLLLLASLLHGWYAGNAAVPISQAAIAFMYYRGYIIAFAAVLLITALTLLWVAKSVWWAASGAGAYFLFFPRVTWRLLIALDLVPRRNEKS
jgi:hypothetical protein